MSATDRPASPTPSERARLDKEAKAKEDAEQAALPYKWTQTISDADVTISVPGNIRGKDLDIVLTKDRVKVGIRGGEVFIDGEFPHPIRMDESTWTLETVPSGKEIAVHLDKMGRMQWWPHIVTNAPKIDVSKIVPENSKLSDLDGETRGLVEKMMFEQRQKEMGRTSAADEEEERKREILRKFQEEHPEMDFTNAQIG